MARGGLPAAEAGGREGLNTGHARLAASKTVAQDVIRRQAGPGQTPEQMSAR